jgi:phospholipid/cholesterol/gamma-HCH transport system substrate-binding protein
MERSPVRDTVVGLFVLAGIGAIAYLSISVGGFRFFGNRGLKLSADFNETGDLAVRAPVVIGGVRVGEITGITLEKNFRARVDMDLERDLKLPVDTSAAIVTAGMLGDRYIELQPGGEDALLKPGDKIAFTESAVILERLIGQLVYGVTNSEKKEGQSAPAATGRGADLQKP